MTTLVRDLLQRQFETASALLHYHLDTLTTQECLWRPAAQGLHVRQDDGGRWIADWPEHEGYDLGPPSIAWTTWHLGFWWSMLLDHSFGDGRLDKDQVVWPGSAEGVIAWIGDLERRWRDHLANLDDVALASSAHSKWPIADRPFAEIVAWATVELTKNAAEIGQTRFLHAVRNGD